MKPASTPRVILATSGAVTPAVARNGPTLSERAGVWGVRVLVDDTVVAEQGPTEVRSEQDQLREHN
jgi:hypothetical protein